MATQRQGRRLRRRRQQQQPPPKQRRASLRPLSVLLAAAAAFCWASSSALLVLAERSAAAAAAAAAAEIEVDDEGVEVGGFRPGRSSPSFFFSAAAEARAVEGEGFEKNPVDDERDDDDIGHDHEDHDDDHDDDEGHEGDDEEHQENSSLEAAPGEREDDDEESESEPHDDDDDDSLSSFSSLLRLTLDAFTSGEKYRALFSTEARRETTRTRDADEEEGADPGAGVFEDSSDEENEDIQFRRSLVLALVVHDEADDDDDGEDHSPDASSCPHTVPMLHKFRDAAEALQHIPTLRLGVLTIREAETLRELGIDRVPALVFVAWLHESDSVLLIEYNGLMDTSQDIAETAQHYWHRLVDATSGWEDLSSSTSTQNSNSNMVRVHVPHYPSYRELRQYLSRSHILDPAAHPRVLPPLPPTLLDGDVRVARWLLREEEDESENEQVQGEPLSLPDDSKLFVQCRRSSSMSSSSDNDEAYRMFDQASRALSNRRDCFFATVHECGTVHTGRRPKQDGDGDKHERSDEKEDDDDDDLDDDNDDGTVAAFSIPYDWDYESMDVVTHLVPALLRHRPDPSGSSSSALIHDVAQFARPSVLWFDRQSTAPIVFGMHQKIHALLVVDLHPVLTGADDANRVDDLRAVRRVVVLFRRECRKYQNWHVACLVVPSTETRVLTTLGIDLWTPLDELATTAANSRRSHHHQHKSAASSAGGDTNASETVPPRPLPVLIMTDRQRVPGKTLRYRLDREQLLGQVDTAGAAVSKFFDDFVSHRLEPVIKSDPRGPRTNAAGVRILTGRSLYEQRGGGGGGEDDDDNPNETHHALVLFVAPTCGHCKRATVVWDRLARFVARVNWTSFVRLYRIDVTANDVPDGVTPRWLPDAYHHHHHHSRGQGGNFTRFDWIHDDGVPAGGDESGGSDDFVKNYDPSAVADAAADWDVATLLEWFVSVANLTDAQVSGLLRDLEEQ